MRRPLPRCKCNQQLANLAPQVSHLEIAHGGHHELRRAPLGSLAAGLHLVPRTLSNDHLAPNGTKYTTRHARGYRKVVGVSRKSPATTTRIRVEWRVSISDWAGGKGSTVKQFAPFDGQSGWSATTVNGFLDALTTKWRVRAQVPPDRGLTAKFELGPPMSLDPSNAHLDKAYSNGPY